MNADFKISFQKDLDYYEEAYSEIIKNNRLKRLEPVFAIVIILFGLALWYFDKNGTLELFPILFSGLGLFELIKIYVSKKKWINDRMKSGIAGQDLYIQFTDDLIIHSGPFSSGNIKWIGIKSIEETKRGLIIKPENGIVIYLPKIKFENKGQIDFIISKSRK